MNIRKGLVLSLLVLFAGTGFLFASGGQEEQAAPAAESLPYEGKVLHFAVMADQYADYIKEISSEFQAATGAEVKVDILGYVELSQKITQDYATGSADYDLATVDIVWTGQFEQEGYTKDLSAWIERDKEEIDYDDIVPVMWVMGGWNGKQIAYPMSGYANSLIYRKDLFEDVDEKAAFKAEYGYELSTPDTLDQLADIAAFFTRKDESMYGLVSNGARGSAVAQDWMEYMRAFGGQIIQDGEVTIDSAECKAALELFVQIFDDWAPSGAIGYWWDDRETAYRTGQAMMQQSWSIARSGYENEEISLVAGKTGMAIPPTAPGVDVGYGVGGWGVGINADSSEENAEIAWEFIKFMTSKEVMKDWMMNDGAPIRYSTLKDPDLNAEMPWLSNILNSFENGDGDYRPRIPEYNEIQDIVGLRVNQAITHELTVDEALAAAAEDIKAIF
ncbi:MAG: extracellular solute-binding protein [Spirochaetales bacterium]|nr:extracellular solute-binding protein [Spirochaetales bacterium]